MTHHSFFLQFMKGGKGLADHLLQVGKLDVMNVNEVYKVYVKAFQALVDAFLGSTCAVVPRIVPVFTIAAHFR